MQKTKFIYLGSLILILLMFICYNSYNSYNRLSYFSSDVRVFQADGYGEKGTYIGATSIYPVMNKIKFRTLDSFGKED